MLTITQKCKELFEKVLKENEADALVISLGEEVDGQVAVNLNVCKEADAPRIVEIQGLRVAISQEDQEEMSDIIFDAEGEDILIGVRDHGCGCGHHHHHDGEECCCGHHHDEDHECCHEEGECCCGEDHDGECCCGDHCDCHE